MAKEIMEFMLPLVFPGVVGRPKPSSSNPVLHFPQAAPAVSLAVDHRSFIPFKRG